ncbi:hypothetical protein BP5796_02417 [Coleophoma crateriformis]|uniref:Distal membrane-arm assembly complex protein 1-like domain-containing protein n=1 Tax=Coleophoma crateriformis TaxID=565419 RepID=A0A3D8SY42_9HELO|nr:hypothetical protein BP5796_02417 [Coleophoma crateriformis]
MFGSSKTPSVAELERPERLEVLQRQDRGDDCLPCRVTGATAFIGLGVYSYFSGSNQLKLNHAKIVQSKSLFGVQSRQAGISMIALSLIGMGMYRLVN